MAIGYPWEGAAAWGDGLSESQSSPYVVVEADSAEVAAGIELVPEIVPTRALRNGGRIPVSARVTQST